MWNQEKKKSQRRYFQEQRKNPTGNFTEYITRIYYNIIKQANDKKYCAVKKLNYHQLSVDMYKGIYNHPDHDAYGTIQSCLKELTNMGYIHKEEIDHQEYIVIDKELDYLLEGEHEKYLKKYGVYSFMQLDLNLKINEINSQNEHEVLLNHMCDPQNHAYKHKIEDVLSCKKCDGHYILREGKFGPFYGCDNYPKCRSTGKVYTLTYDILVNKGMAIYEIEVKCWKCHKPIKIISYFPYFDLCQVDHNLKKFNKLQVIRLSILKEIDEKLETEYPNITQVYSKKAGFSYTGNVCEHCGALQGSTKALETMFYELNRCFESSQLKGSVIKRIAINDDILSRKEWENIIHQLILDL